MTFRPDIKQKKDQNIQRDTKPYNMSEIKIDPIYLHAFVLIETRHKICSTSQTTFYFILLLLFIVLSLEICCISETKWVAIDFSC